MKRKLSLLLAMVLAMTMVMGIGVTSFAATRPAGVSMDEADCTKHSESEIHFYSFGDTVTQTGHTTEYVAGIIYSPTIIGPDPVVVTQAYLDSGDGFGLTPDWFEDNSISEGWYWCDDEMTLHLCDGHLSSEDPDDPTPSGSTSPAHVHNFQWQTITAPTKDADGLEGEMCSCGAVRNTQPLTAYGYALNQYATPMINAAKAGQTITFEFGEWNSFPKSFMAKLVDKSAQNVTFVFKYKWNHKLQTITIPAGTPIDLNFDWYGPAKMAELYGAN